MLPALRDVHANLAWLHDGMKAAVRELDPARLDWTPAPGANSVARLVAHVAWSERYWIGERVGGEPVSGAREDAFAAAGLGADALCALLDGALASSRRALDAVAPADLEREYTTGPDGPVTVMGPLAHALEHTALHAGHVELTRDLARRRTSPPR